MKLSCDIIKDLLPLYHDGVCSDESRRLIEEHLAVCDSCRVELHQMDNTLSLDTTTTNIEEAHVVKKLSKQWKKDMFISLVKGMILTLFVLAVFALVLYGILDFRIVPQL